MLSTGAYGNIFETKVVEILLITALKKGITGYREFITVPEKGSIEIRLGTGL